MRQPHIGAASRTPQSPQSSPELPHSHLDTSVGSATSSPSSVPAPASTASHVTFRAPGAAVQRQEDVQVHAAFAGRPERYAAARTAGGGLQAALGKPRKQTRKPRKLPSLGCNALRRGRMGTVQWVFFLIPYVLLLHFSVVFAWAKADIFNPKYAPYKAGFRRTNRDSVPRAFEYTAEAVGVVAMGFSCLMMLVCLYRAHATSPGVVVRALFVEADHFETKSDGSPRKCRKCDHKNPPPKVDRSVSQCVCVGWGGCGFCSPCLYGPVFFLLFLVGCCTCVCTSLFGVRVLFLCQLPPLQVVSAVCVKHGPPLHVIGRLRRAVQLQVLLFVAGVHIHIPRLVPGVHGVPGAVGVPVPVVARQRLLLYVELAGAYRCSMPLSLWLSPFGSPCCVVFVAVVVVVAFCSWLFA